jgi:alpha-glucoside transport system substrate-binding protein
MLGPRPGRARKGVWAVLCAQVALLGLGLAAAGCDTQPPAVSGEVEVLGSWSGAELSAFREVVAPFEDRSGISVTYSTTRDLRGVLAGRLAQNDPPDLAGLEGPAHMAELAAAGHLRDLAQILDIGAYRARVAPTVIELSTVDGRLVGVFVRSNLKGLIWYNPSVFQLGAPRTWDELQRMAIQARTVADAEWCVGLESEEASGWPGTDLIEQFLLREAGVDVYDRWISGDVAWTSAEVRRAFELYGQVVADTSVHGGSRGALETDFREAGEPLFGDSPGCLFLHQGSFMPAFFGVERTAGVDYDFFPFPDLLPGAQKSVIGGGDLFGVLTDDQAAIELIRYLVSDEAQSLWAAQGGSLSVNVGVTDYPDPVSTRAAQLLTAADLFRFDASDSMPSAVSAAFRAAVLDFTAERVRLDAILAELEAVRHAEYDR